MADKTNGHQPGGLQSLVDELPLDRLKEELQDTVKALGERAVEGLGNKITDATGSLTDVANNGGFTGSVMKGGAKAWAEGDSPVAGALKGGVVGVKDKVKGALPGGKSGGKSGGGGKGSTKAMNIIEEIDIGVPIDVAYNQWTQFQDFSGFMKKVHGVEQEDDAKLNFKAQVFWSHRTWEATILEQIPDTRIVWRSKGAKGHVDGAVTFHELGPNLTRVLVVLEYYPQGFMERTGNLWRAQGRRARLELKHFRRHVMTRTILEPEEVEGWRGEIRDGEVVKTHEEALEEEERDQSEGEPEDEYAEEDEYEDEGEPEDEYEDEGEPEDEYDEEGEPEDEYDEEGEPEDEYEAEDEDDEYEDEPEDEYDEDDEVTEEEDDQPRRRSSAKRETARKAR